MHDMRQPREISAGMARACAITVFFRDALCFSSLAWGARAMRLEGQAHLSGAHEWRKEDQQKQSWADLGARDTITRHAK